MIIEKRIKFSSNHHEIETLLNNGERLAVQFEGEVSGETKKPVGEGNELVIYTVMPLAVQIKGIDPQYNTPKQEAVPKNKSKSKQLYDVLYVYWQQQLSNKYENFEDFYNMWMDSKIEQVKENLL